jgi:ribosome-associated protein
MTKSETPRKTGPRGGRLPEDVRVAVRAALDKKAQHLTVLDLRKAAAFTDFFVICTGQTSRQVKAIAEAIEEALDKAGVHLSHVEGAAHAEWVLMDCFDFVVHVFTPDTREFYALDRLWGSAVRLEPAEADLR